MLFVSTAGMARAVFFGPVGGYKMLSGAMHHFLLYWEVQICMKNGDIQGIFAPTPEHEWDDSTQYDELSPFGVPLSNVCDNHSSLHSSRW
jgi:hypothetical protein